MHEAPDSTPGDASPRSIRPRIAVLGVIIGTAAYMAPEQARAAAWTKADIWAFGVVLFEMLTGRRLFGGGASRVNKS